jgi:hypothetical protein
MRKLSLFFLLSAVLFLSNPGRADYIVRTQAMFANTIAEFYITEGAVRVELEIGTQDVPAFRDLLPDDLYRKLGYGDQPLGQRLRKFYTEGLVISDGSRALPAILERIEPAERVRRDEVSGEPIPGDQKQPETVILVTLRYALEGQPAKLFFKPPLQYGPANIGFVVYHNGVAVNDFRYLGTQASLNLDWTDPWYSAFESRSLRRSYNAPMSGFLYIEPFEVRKEIIVRPKDLGYWLDLGLEGLDTIPVAMQADIRDKVAGFLGQHLPVTIDGQPVQMRLERVNFLSRTLRNSTVIDPPQELPLDAAVMGLIYVLETEYLPEKATLTWDLFNDRIQRVPAAATDQAGPFPQFLDPDYAVLEWQNFLKNPYIPQLIVLQQPPSALAVVGLWLRWLLLAAAVLLLLWTAVASRKSGALARGAAIASLVCGIAAALVYWQSLAAQRVVADPEIIVSSLLKNIYHAFDFRQQEKIYDVLAASVDGDLLTDIYLETLRGLELSNQGGARAKVKSVELQALAAEPLSANNGFVAEVTWQVQASVGHWGHVHQRVNQYQALVWIAPVAGQWRMTSLEVLSEERL